MTTPSRHPVQDLLLERGANDIAHPGGTLFAHLLRVAGLLETWDAQEVVQVAGLCHACYGTDGFPVALLALHERALLAHHIGPAAEALVYRYASCDRRTVHPTLGTPGSLRFRDRFTGATSMVAGEDAARFVELTAANELDLVMVNASWARDAGPQLLELLRGTRTRLGAAAWHACDTELTAVFGHPGPD